MTYEVMPLGYALSLLFRRASRAATARAAAIALVAAGAGCGSDGRASVALGIEAQFDARTGLESGADESIAASRDDLINDDGGAANAADAADGAATSDATGGDDGPTANALTLCLRLQDPRRPAGTVQLSLMVQQAYIRGVYSDCDVAAMIARDEDTLSDFENALVAWNLHFWGCDEQPPTDLGILRTGFPDVTSADIARLIDHYVDSAVQVLAMSPGEDIAMREALARLSATTSQRAVDEFSLSTCATDAGAAADDAVSGDADGGTR